MPSNDNCQPRRRVIMTACGWHAEVSPAVAARIAADAEQQLPANGESVLLTTGARLYRRLNTFFVGGYAHNGSDVLPYV